MSPPTPTPGSLHISEGARLDYSDWVNRNPLRAWRREQTPKMPILEAASRLGVGTSMLQMYERGVHKPGPKSALAVERLLGPAWSTAWDRWLATRPT